MIRLKKSEAIPASLQVPNCNKYDGQDVQDTLYEDQDGKCYLCEQTTRKNFEIEHFKAKSAYSDSKYTWDNLLLSCPYCNARKSSGYKELMNPLEHNIEEIIEQRLVFSKNTIELKSSNTSESANTTINLLERLLNGKSGLRDKKAEILYKDIEQTITVFLEHLIRYKSEPSSENKQIVIDSLKIHKEFLALKYWLVKDHSDLYEVFGSYMVWNRSPLQ